MLLLLTFNNSVTESNDGYSEAHTGFGPGCLDVLRRPWRTLRRSLLWLWEWGELVQRFRKLCIAVGTAAGSLQGKCIARGQVSAFPVQRQHGAKGCPSCGDKFKHFPPKTPFETTKYLPRHIPSITRGELRAVNLNIAGGRSMTNPTLTGSVQSPMITGAEAIWRLVLWGCFCGWWCTYI